MSTDFSYGCKEFSHFSFSPLPFTLLTMTTIRLYVCVCVLACLLLIPASFIVDDFLILEVAIIIQQKENRRKGANKRWSFVVVAFHISFATMFLLSIWLYPQAFHVSKKKIKQRPVRCEFSFARCFSIVHSRMYRFSYCVYFLFCRSCFAVDIYFAFQFCAAHLFASVHPYKHTIKYMGNRSEQKT